MPKEQFNLRLDSKIIQRIHEVARQQEKSATQVVTEAIVTALGLQTESQPPPIPLEQIKELIAEECSKWADPFNARVNVVGENFGDQIQDLKSLINSSKAAALYYTGKVETELLTRIMELEEAVEGLQKSKSSQLKPAKTENNPKTKPLRLSQLADRLGVDEKIIIQNKLEKTFNYWSKQLDPNSIGWRLERGKFLPDQPIPTKEQALEVDEPVEVLSGDSLVVA